MSSCRHTIVAGMAALLIALAAATTQANRLSVTNHNFRIVWRNLRFQEPSGFFGNIECPLTLEGSFHYNTIAKREGALIGHVSRGSIASASCSSGHMTVLAATLPWHVTYQGFRGILPNITSLRLLFVGWSFSLESSILGGAIICLARSTVEHPVAGEAGLGASGEVNNVIPDPNVLIPVTSPNGRGECPGSNLKYGAGSADGVVTLLGNTMKISVRLI